jgi:DUF4097 and DUF4098 domain-containing protein YvlB
MHVFDTPGSVSLQLKLPSGRVVVATADEPRTTVEVVAVGRRGQEAAEEVEVVMEERHGRSVIRVEQKDKFRWGPIQITWGGDFECRITCPPGTDLDLAGGSTNLRAEGELGEVSVRTASGDVELESARGELQVKTASGDIGVEECFASGSLVTVSGDVRISWLEGGSFKARSVSGDVSIGTLRADLELATTSGDVEVKAVSLGELRVQTVSGDVRVGITRGTRTWIDAASVSGRLESELGLEDAEPAQEAEGDDAIVPLRLKTVSGDVSIVRSSVLTSA